MEGALLRALWRYQQLKLGGNLLLQQRWVLIRLLGTFLMQGVRLVWLPRQVGTRLDLMQALMQAYPLEELHLNRIL